MDLRVALLEKSVSEIQATVDLLRKLEEEHSSGLSDIRQHAVETEEVKQLRAVTEALQIQGFDGDEESIDSEEKKGEAGLISLKAKGKDVSDELEEQKDERLSQLKEDDLSRSKLMQFADHCTLSDKQYVPEMMPKSSEPKLADLQTKQRVRNSTEEQEQLKIFSELVSLSQLPITDKKALVKCWKVFETLQKEAETMTYTIRELRKENEYLKNKSEAFDRTYADSLLQRKRLMEELEKTKRQNAKLESLCRSLHAERKKSSSQEKKE